MSPCGHIHSIQSSQHFQQHSELLNFNQKTCPSGRPQGYLIFHFGTIAQFQLNMSIEGSFTLIDEHNIGSMDAKKKRSREFFFLFFGGAVTALIFTKTSS